VRVLLCKQLDLQIQQVGNRAGISQTVIGVTKDNAACGWLVTIHTRRDETGTRAREQGCGRGQRQWEPDDWVSAGDWVETCVRGEEKEKEETHQMVNKPRSGKLRVTGHGSREQGGNRKE